MILLPSPPVPVSIPMLLPSPWPRPPPTPSQLPWRQLTAPLPPKALTKKPAAVGLVLPVYQWKSAKPVDAAKSDPMTALGIFRNDKPKPKATVVHKTKIGNASVVHPYHHTVVAHCHNDPVLTHRQHDLVLEEKEEEQRGWTWRQHSSQTQAATWAIAKDP